MKRVSVPSPRQRVRHQLQSWHLNLLPLSPIVYLKCKSSRILVCVCVCVCVFECVYVCVCVCVCVHICMHVTCMSHSFSLSLSPFVCCTCAFVVVSCVALRAEMSHLHQPIFVLHNENICTPAVSAHC